LKISIASGKGGTGKTTIATNLAITLAQRGRDVTYVDCDVEEPNGHLFLKPEIKKTEPVPVLVPHVDLEKCTFCGECAKVCEYNAIAVLKNKVMVFPSLCHSCGGCYWICPEKAIDEIPRTIGVINSGNGDGLMFYEGRLNIGEALSPPVTKALKKNVPESEVVVIDAPPGTSCPVIEAINGTDFVILVTEPTPFGLNDLKLAVGMVREMRIPFGVVINCSDIGDKGVEKYCQTEDIDILMKILYDRKIAEAYSKGELVSLVNSGLLGNLYELYETIVSKVNHDGTRDNKR